MKKYLKVMLVLVVVLSILSTFAFAAPFDGIKTAMADQNNDAGNVGNVVNNVGATVISVIQTVGYVVAVVMVLVVGIQWLIGTPAKKQELKGKMWNILIGAVLIIAGVSILGIVADFAEDIDDELTSSLSMKA